MAKKLNFIALIILPLLISFCFLGNGHETSEPPRPDDEKRHGPSPRGPGHPALPPQLDDEKKHGPSPKGPGHYAGPPGLEDNKREGPSPRGAGHKDAVADTPESSGGSRKESFGYAAFSLIILTVSKCIHF
ncbi:hypothetical protein LXL04_031743 [Taraxacum kok-saghyz]